MTSPKPVPTRGMHTRNQATSQAGTVSRSKGASPGKTRVLHVDQGSLASLGSLEPLESLESLGPGSPWTPWGP